MLSRSPKVPLKGSIQAILMGSNTVDVGTTRVRGLSNDVLMSIGCGTMGSSVVIAQPGSIGCDDETTDVGFICTVIPQDESVPALACMDCTVSVPLATPPSRTTVYGLKPSRGASIKVLVMMPEPLNDDLVAVHTKCIRKWLWSKTVCEGAIIRLPAEYGTYALIDYTTPRNVFVTIESSTFIDVQFSGSKTESVITAPADPIGGLEHAIEQLRDLVIAPLRYSRLCKDVKYSPSAGVLLYGPPGVGKTLLVRHILHTAEEFFPVKLVSIRGPELVSPIPGESERQIRDIFETGQKFIAAQSALFAVFFDEMDAMCPNRESASPIQARIVTQLLALMDGIVKHVPKGRFVVIGATNRPEALDPALRRPGRLDREICIEPPSVEGRIEILIEHSKGMPVSEECKAHYKELSETLVGYVGADLAALCREACLRAINRSSSVEMEDFDAARAIVGASALRSVQTIAPTVKWEDIGGYQPIKQRLQQAVVWPILHSDAMARFHLHRPTGILLYGPPGCSKTTLVKAAANACNSSFVSLSGADVFSPYVGEAERKIREIFRIARQAAPCIVFFDEIDAMVSKRDLVGGDGGSSGMETGVLATLLNEMDGVEEAKDVMIMAATNRKETLDAALLRPGRFDIQLYIGLPPLSARLQILQVHLRIVTLSSDVDLSHIASCTAGYTGAEIESICREACMLALRTNIETNLLTQCHLLEAMSAIKPQHSLCIVADE